MASDRQVGEQKLADNVTGQNPRSAYMGEQVNCDIHGLHYENAVRNRMFVYGVASQALLLSATTGGHPTVWNPATSGMLFIPTKVCLSFISGTTVIGGVNWHITTGAGNAVAATLPIKSATLVAAQSANVGNSNTRASAMNWSPTTNTFLVAPTFLAATGLNLGAAAPTGSGTYEAKQDGSIVIWPGTALSLCYTVTTSTAVFAVSIFGVELPVPLSN